MGAIILTGIGSSDPIPGVYAETNFAAGASTGDTGARPMVFFVNKTAAGSATVNTEVYGPDTENPLSSEAHMIALGGPGSEGHRLFRRVADLNKTNPMYWVFVTESAGAKAAGTIVITGTATKVGSVRVYVVDDFVDVPISNGMTATLLGDAVAAAVNARAEWPVTAANVTGTVTLTAKQNGLRGNFIRYQVVRFNGDGLSFTATTDSALANGAASDSNTTAIATLKGRGDYYVVSAANDATQLGALSTHIATQALPANGNPKRLFAATTDSLATANALAIGLNDPRAELLWQYKGVWTPAEIAAHMAAIYAMEEASVKPRTNFAGYGQDARTQGIFKVPPPRDKTARPDRSTDLTPAILNGLSPIAVDGRGVRCYLVDRITTRTLNGAIPDYRIRDAHKVTICDYFSRDWVTKVALQMSGKKIGDNPLPGMKQPDADVVTPDRLKALTIGLLDTYDGNGLLQGVQQTKDESVFQRETVPTTRMSARIPIRPIDNAKQFQLALDQVA